MSGSEALQALFRIHPKSPLLMLYLRFVASQRTPIPEIWC